MHQPSGVPRGPSHLQFPWLLRATMRSPLRSPAQVEGTQGFLPQPENDLERPSSTRLEARFPYHGSGAMTRSPSPLAWRPPSELQEIPVAIREQSGVLGFHSRGMPVSPGASGMQPRDPCRPWRGTLASGPKPRGGLLALQSLESNPQLSFATRMEDWTCLGQHKRQPEFPVVTRESRRNSRKTTWLPPSSQDEALSRYSASGEVPR